MSDIKRYMPTLTNTGETPWPNIKLTEASMVESSDGEWVRYDYLSQLKARIAELESEALPNEHGKNEYGLDVSYFRKTINRELNRDLSRFKPDELARVLARLSLTADEKVILEDEFAGKRIAELEREREQRDLEQQIKVLKGFAEYYECEAVKRGVGRYIEQIRKGGEHE